MVIDAGHGGYDRGGGPGQRIAESTYTLDTARRLQRALRSRGFRTVMTRDEDVFVTLRDRVAIGASYRNAVFVSVHYNSGSRLDAHGYETYYYRSDSFGLASRLHAAQLSTLNTEDRHVRRRGFYVLRNPSTPAVLCEGGFLTNPGEASTIMSSSYRERWAQNIAAALVEQRRYGDPAELGYQPPVTTEHFYRGRRSLGAAVGAVIQPEPWRTPHAADAAAAVVLTGAARRQLRHRTQQRQRQPSSRQRQRPRPRRSTIDDPSCAFGGRRSPRLPS